MSARGDDLSRLASDLRSYLRQRQQEGLEWYLAPGAAGAGGDEGAGATAVARAAATVGAGAPVGAAAGAAGGAAGAAADGSEAQPGGGDPPARRPVDEEFARSCRRFVEQALDQVRRQGSTPQPPKQQDIFSAAVPADQPIKLTRAEKEAALAELARQVAVCTRCKLHETRTQGVFGVGDPDANLVFIGEAPGRDEDRLGEPFVGRAGKLLNDILRAIGFRREDVYICNILKSRPPDNRDPEPDEVEACEPYLIRQLEIIEPRVICCLGRVAAQNLLKTRASLGSLREGVHFYEGIPVLVTYHPAALLRNPHWKRPTWDDVRRLRALHDALAGEAGG